MEHRLDTELDRPDDREEPECWECGGEDFVEVDLLNKLEWVPCPACKGVKDE
jgi:hypothetical protein